jgi:monofunctional glycosyltransferase
VKKRPAPSRAPKRRAGTRLRWWIRLPLLLVIALHVIWAVALAGLRFIDPPTTGVQMQRRVESWFQKGEYRKRFEFVPLNRISSNLHHAAIAAEDGRFYQHWGIDWDQLGKVIDEGRESGEIPRGASTISQQLVKNLFFTTHRNPVRKAFEYTLAPMANLILGKRRILELYLNVVEWGPGVYGAEAAARYHYGISAARLDRDQASRLAACLPSPRRRRPAAMNSYSLIIQDRMTLLGW